MHHKVSDLALFEVKEEGPKYEFSALFSVVPLLIIEYLFLKIFVDFLYNDM